MPPELGGFPPPDNAKPVLTRFSFLPTVSWEKIPVAFSQAVIKSDRTLLESFTTGGSQVNTRLTATLENKSRYSFADMEVVAILYDKNGNAITSSQVLLPKLLAESTKNITFTWPYSMRSQVVQIEIIPRFDPFTAEAL